MMVMLTVVFGAAGVMAAFVLEHQNLQRLARRLSGGLGRRLDGHMGGEQQPPSKVALEVLESWQNTPKPEGVFTDRRRR